MRFDASVPSLLRAKEYEPIPTTITGYSPWLNRIKIDAPDSQGLRLLTATFNNSGMVTNFATPPPTTPSAFAFPGVPPGNYTLYVRYPNDSNGDRRTLIVEPVGSKITINTFCDNGTFTCTLARAGTVTTYVGTSSYDVESDSEFKAWSAAGPAPASAVPVYRLKFLTGGHPFVFFTANASDVALLTSAGFINDGVQFHALPVKDGICAAATQPVYRLFNGGGLGPGHRYTTDVSAYRHWAQHNQCANVHGINSCVAEGVAFCAPVE